VWCCGGYKDEEDEESWRDEGCRRRMVKLETLPGIGRGGFLKIMKEGYKVHFGLVSDEEGYFCPFPCSFVESDKWLANLVTWQSLSGSRDEILND